MTNNVNFELVEVRDNGLWELEYKLGASEDTVTYKEYWDGEPTGETVYVVGLTIFSDGQSIRALEVLGVKDNVDGISNDEWFQNVFPSSVFDLAERLHNEAKASGLI